jgi:hypothetical protein
VKADKKDVIGEQHKPGELISKPALSKGVVSKVTYFPAISSVLVPLYAVESPYMAGK